MNNFKEIYSNIFLSNALSGCDTEFFEEKFRKLAHFLTEENNKYNLTAVKTAELIIPLHFADSLIAAELFPKNSSVIDVGCGAGFPSLPLAIARNDLAVTALDSTAKRTQFAQAAAKILGLSNLQTLTGRAEELSHTRAEREKYDVACARAVARLNVLAELCMPFVKPGGYFIALKGALGEEEYSEAAKGIRLLGGELCEIKEKTLYISENENQKRTFIIIKKTKSTPPEYPRAYAKILKNPLGR